MIAQILIHRVVDGRAEWDPVTGDVVGPNSEFVWTGPARVQDNKDWRARNVEAGTDPQMVQYARIQIPITPDNEPPVIEVNDIIYVLTPPDVCHVRVKTPPKADWTVRSYPHRIAGSGARSSTSSSSS